MAFDYFLLVFIASIGVYQIASIPAKLKGLWFFTHRKLQYSFGVLAIISAFGWFFTAEERNIQHTVEGSQQLWLFLGAIIAAYVATAILSSVMEASVDSQGNDAGQGTQHEQGMETLKTTTVFGGVLNSLLKKRKEEE
jgi:hypothetical protein